MPASNFSKVLLSADGNIRAFGPTFPVAPAPGTFEPLPVAFAFTLFQGGNLASGATLAGRESSWDAVASARTGDFQLGEAWGHGTATIVTAGTEPEFSVVTWSHKVTIERL